MFPCLGSCACMAMHACMGIVHKIYNLQQQKIAIDIPLLSNPITERCNVLVLDQWSWDSASASDRSSSLLYLVTCVHPWWHLSFSVHGVRHFSTATFASSRPWASSASEPLPVLVSFVLIYSSLTTWQLYFDWVHLYGCILWTLYSFHLLPLLALKA